MKETIKGLDHRLSHLSQDKGGDEFNIKEWNIGRLVSEATHLITCEIYKIGDLVV
jgi:hypothetical protein